MNYYKITSFSVSDLVTYKPLVLADHIYDDAVTHKKVIAGTFNTLAFSTKPLGHEWKDDHGNAHRGIPGGMQSGSPWAYISLTELQGKVDLELQYIDLKDHSILLKTRFQVTSRNPLDTAELVLPMPVLPTPHERDLLRGRKRGGRNCRSLVPDLPSYFICLAPKTYLWH